MIRLEDALDLSKTSVPVKVKKKDTFFDTIFNYVNSIILTKQNLMVTDEDEKFYEKARFQLHRALSFYPDLVMAVNLLNARNMSPRMEYEFLLNFIPAKQRRSKKWIKKPAASMYMDTVQKYYGYNENKAEAAIRLLTVEQLGDIERKIRKEDEWTFSEGMGQK